MCMYVYMYVCVYTFECVSIARSARDAMWLEKQHQHYSRMFEGQSVWTVATQQISYESKFKVDLSEIEVVRFRAKQRVVPLLQHLQTDCGFIPLSRLLSTGYCGILPRGSGDTYFLLVPRLRMGGAVPPLTPVVTIRSRYALSSMPCHIFVISQYPRSPDPAQQLYCISFVYRRSTGIHWYVLFWLILLSSHLGTADICLAVEIHLNK
jgi:hypothetical protein